MNKKLKLSITMDKELVDWLDEEIKNKEFANRSHAIEKAIFEMKSKKQSSTF